MKQFIKTNNGLKDVTKPKVKVYASIADLQDAVDNGDIAEGEIVATKFVDNAQDDSMNVEAIENQISNINAMIPNGTSALNQLVNASQVAQMGSVSSVTVGSTQYTPDADGDVCIPAYPPDLSGCAGLSCVGTVTSVNNTAPDANGDVTINLPPDLSGCPGLNCTGTLTSSDISSFIDADCAGVIANCCIDATGFATAIDCAQCDISDIQDLIPSTADPATSKIVDQCTLDSCGYTTCTGTVTAVCAGSTCYTPTSGVITLPNGASATITLSGSDLTITF